MSERESIADGDRGSFYHARQDGSFGFIEPLDTYIEEKLPLTYDLAFDPNDPAFTTVADKRVLQEMLSNQDRPAITYDYLSNPSDPDQYDIQRVAPIVPQEQAQQGEQ